MKHHSVALEFRCRSGCCLFFTHEDFFVVLDEKLQHRVFTVVNFVLKAFW